MPPQKGRKFKTARQIVYQILELRTLQVGDELLMDSKPVRKEFVSKVGIPGITTLSTSKGGDIITETYYGIRTPSPDITFIDYGGQRNVKNGRDTDFASFSKRYNQLSGAGQ